MKKNTLPALLFLLLSLGCTLTDNLKSAPSPTTPPATSTPQPQAVQPHPSATPSPVEGNVYLICFANDYAGLVRVRECASIDCREIGLLPAGAKVNLLATQRGASGAWGQIGTPVPGWVNLRFLCEN